MVTKKIPDAVAGSDYTDADSFSVPAMLMAKEGWQRERAVSNNPTATIVRQTESGGAAYAGIDPDYVLVSGLSNLPVMVNDNPYQLERKHGALFKSGDLEFVFYLAEDIEVQADDIVRYDGEDYKPIRVDYEAESGRNEVLARLVRSV